MFLRHPVPGWYSIEELFATVRDHLPADIAVTVVVLPQPSRGLTPRLRNLWHAWRHRGEINHVTGDVHYISLALPRSRTILTIHDVGGMLSLRGLRQWLLKVVWYQIPVWWVRSVTAISDFTRDELVALLPRSTPKLRVIPNAISPDFLRGAPATDDPSAPVLCLGTTQNKNLERSIEAAAALDVPLRVVGRATRDQMALLGQCPTPPEIVADLPRPALIDVYRTASLLLFPSLYEGFGMPIVEAQAVGIPVITSDREPMRSVAGGGALLVNPESTEEIRAAIEAVRGDGHLRRRLIDAGTQAQARFRPTAVAAAYAELYRRLSR